jgi:hypothetical protein
MYKMHGEIKRPINSQPQGILMPIVYHELDDALGAARNPIAHGGTAVLIEGNDGARFATQEIVEIIRKRGAQLDGRPKVY